MKKIFSLLLTISICQVLYGQGAVGIGTTTPHAPLQFANYVAERKIVLYEVANNNHQFFGFGLSANGELKYHTGGLYAHVFETALNDTSSLEIMRMTGYGTVGIGCIPQHRLDVHYGSPRSSGHPYNRPFYVSGDIEEGSGIEFRHSNATQGIGFSYNTIYATGNDENQLLQFSSRGNAPLNFKTNNAERMTISGNGNVGINITIPENRFDINNSIPRTGTHANDQTMYVTGNFVNGYGVQFRQSDGTTGIGFTDQAIYAAGSNENQDMLMLAKGPNGIMRFGTNGYERLMISGDGMIGISNSYPHAPLHFTNDVRNRKLVLFEIENNDHQFFGFGVNADGTLRYQTALPAYDHVFYAGSSDTTSNELFRIKGTGRIGIGTSSPHASSILEVASTTKGILIPRMTTGDRNAIASPANGLLVFDITTNSFWFRRLSAWVELSDNLDTEVFRNGTDKIYMGLTDSVGIGTVNPAYKLDVRTGNNAYGFAHTNGDVQIASWIGPGGQIGTVSNHSLSLFAGDGFNQFTLLPNGNIGIGTITPNAPLQFANVTGIRKLVLFDLFNNDHQFFGFGVDVNGHLGYHTQSFGTDHVFYSGNTANLSNELMRVKGTGNVGILTSNPNEILEIAGSGRAFFGDGGGNNRKGLLIDGVETNGARIEAYEYGAGVGLDLLLNTLGGHVGIGILNSNAPLQFSNTSENRKVVLSETVNNNNQFIGFGQNTTSLRYQVDATTSNHIFYAGTSASGSAELMRIEGTGEVGIGLMTPANKLDIAAAIRTGTHNTTGQALYVTGGGEFRSTNAATGLGIGSNNIFATGSNASVDLLLAAKGASGNITFSTNSAEKVRITSTGNVGLGTTNPNAPLQFSNTTTTKKVVLYEYANNTSEFSGFGIDGDGSMRYEVPTEGAEHVFYSGAGVDGFSELMRIGSIHGLTIERGTTIDGYLTTVGNVTVGGTMTVNGSMTVGGTIATEPFVEPTLLNGFANYGAGYATAAYYKDKVGVVHLRGLVNRAANHNGIIVFTLPVGYRPSASGKLLFTTTAQSGPSRFDILTNGDVVVTTGSTGFISLDGITFRAD